jgi:hypothetical protein
VSYPIHLPLNGDNQTVIVYVTPSKTYGNYKGHELIQRYGSKAKDISQDPEVTKHYVFIPNGQLSKVIKFNGEIYPTRTFFNKLEKLYGRRILFRQELKPIKYYQNTSLLIPKDMMKCQTD